LTAPLGGDAWVEYLDLIPGLFNGLSYSTRDRKKTWLLLMSISNEHFYFVIMN
jgi:hypothetical protein